MSNNEENCNSALAVIPYVAPVLKKFHDKERVINLHQFEFSLLQDWDGAGISSVVWDAVSFLKIKKSAIMYLVINCFTQIV